MMIPYAKDNPIIQDSSQESLTSSKYDFKEGGSWHISDHARELKIGTQLKK